ncbi:MULTISPECIES: hypothetical protein [unclassified Halobacillus]|uniref:hypothetical protein n=1 Tax=unclassified Halobacillus TaxID=2636472 RepID=UPI0002A4D139|nr:MULTISPECIES: hypothetical protein [unclassified Halobacillus]ELK44461.1 hypothetical protein D479_19279 [Halobacillus sp. BAB-2008]
MNKQMKSGIGLIGSLLLVMVGLYRLWTNQLEEMSIIVAYLFLGVGIIGTITNGVKWKKHSK